MNAPTDNVPSAQPALMRLLVRSREYRHPRPWVVFRFTAGVWNLFLGVLLLASFHWLGPVALLGVVPLAGAVLIFWTAYRLQQDSVRS